MFIDDYLNEMHTDLKVPENLMEDLAQQYNKVMENLAFSKAYDITPEVIVGPAPYTK